MNQSKLRVIKDFEKLDVLVQKMIKDAYPFGFGDELITITAKDGSLIRALPFETEDKYYLVKFPAGNSAVEEVEEDFDDEVIVKENKKPDLGEDFEDDFNSSDDDDDDYDDPADEGSDDYDEDDED